MARIIGKLTALKVDKAKQPGMYGDGGGLYLRVTDDGARNWVFRFMLNGRPRWMGMGPLHTVSLSEARKRAGEHRLRRHDGIDPIEARRAERLQARLDCGQGGDIQGMCRKTTSRPTVQAGAMLSTPANGTRRLPPMPSPSRQAFSAGD